MRSSPLQSDEDQGRRHLASIPCRRTGGVQPPAGAVRPGQVPLVASKASQAAVSSALGSNGLPCSALSGAQQVLAVPRRSLLDPLERACVGGARRGVLRLHPTIPDERRGSPVRDPSVVMQAVRIDVPTLFVHGPSSAIRREPTRVRAWSSGCLLY